ncbi:hypothetical protein TcasGA2_TC013764 [Tribolium castaneum]|uniref:Uncharacterized protein n=1 Tax=Tribolium castaneum TaxID=7070 RepID=D6WJJ8_TRICA|nr:hypothetical protein TcasGA2_TC013764 [Tribolium castaneum]
MQNCDHRPMQCITVAKSPSESLQTRNIRSTASCYVDLRVVRYTETADRISRNCLHTLPEVRPDRTHFSAFYRENVSTFKTILLDVGHYEAFKRK